eukprot:6874930-Pyramimonas_sp.AAC.1
MERRKAIGSRNSSAVGWKIGASSSAACIRPIHGTWRPADVTIKIGHSQQIDSAPVGSCRLANLLKAMGTCCLLYESSLRDITNAHYISLTKEPIP